VTAPPSSPRVVWIAACTAVSALCYYVSIGLGEFWPAAWVAPIPLLVLALQAPWYICGPAALVAYFAGSLNLFTYLTGVLPVSVVLIALLLSAAVCGASIVIAWFAVRRLPHGVAVLAFPAAWTSLEFLISLSSPHGTVHSIGYSQTDVLPLVQIASVTGIWGVVFVLALVPSAATIAWLRRSAAAFVPTAVAVAVVLAFGAVRLNGSAAAPVVRVGLAASDEHIREVFATEEPFVASSVAREYAARIAKAAAARARIVVLPEKLVGVTSADEAGVLAILGDAARSAGAMVVAGVNAVGQKPLRNVAVVFGADGKVLEKYEKHHLLPGAETGYAAGNRPGLFRGPSGPWGVEICKDMDFTGWSRQYGMVGVRALAVPAWDFVRDGRFHSRMALVRGVEQGFALVRAAQEGLLTAADAYGRILAQAPSAAGRGAVLVADVPLGPGATIYTNIGDVFGWLIVAELVVLLVAAARSRVRWIR
jgi:apolipoprotein N-acyltransferase